MQVLSRFDTTRKPHHSNNQLLVASVGLGQVKVMVGRTAATSGVDDAKLPGPSHPINSYVAKWTVLDR